MIKFKKVYFLLVLFVMIGCSSDVKELGPVPPVSSDARYAVVDRSASVKLIASDRNVKDILTYRVISQPLYGKLQGEAPNLTYIADSNYTTHDSFKYLSNDGKFDSNEATVYLVNGVTISGVISYDLVKFHITSLANHKGRLNYNNISKESSKNIIVSLLDKNGIALSSTTTDQNGKYEFLDIVPVDTDVKIRASAKMLKLKNDGESDWDVEILDNTNSDSLYVMDGSYIDSGYNNSQRDLKAPLKGRVAAPFAILDTIYKSMSLILEIDNKISFKPLDIHWSVYNVASDGKISSGQIITSYYKDFNLYILGDLSYGGDADEYDNHVIAHEWGHYYEETFSRIDSIGGMHNNGDKLDIRVAFSEGWANAFSSMALDDAIYFDTSSTSGEGWFMNMESEEHDEPGWFSEASIQRILYDIYDADDEAHDKLSFGFAPIHSVLSGEQKVVKSFTSIFSFITILKDTNSNSTKIDNIVKNENINVIENIYGKSSAGNHSLYPYVDFVNGMRIRTTKDRRSQGLNKLSNHKYVSFKIEDSGKYKISVKQIGGSSSDPDFYLFNTYPFENIAISEDESKGFESQTVYMKSGDYLLDIVEFNNLSDIDFRITIEK